MTSDHTDSSRAEPGVFPVRYSRRARSAKCPCCGRELPLTFHHLIPRKLHRRRHFRRHYSRNTLLLGIYVCRDCHDVIHRTYSEMELAQNYAQPDALLADDNLRRQFDWLSRQRRRAP